MDDKWPSESTQEKMGRLAHDVRDKAADASEKIAEKFDRGREAAADKMEDAATTLSQTAAEFPAGRGLADTLEGAAQRLGAGARYIREHDLEAVLNDTRDCVRTHPGGALAVAAAAGLVLGLLLSRDRSEAF